MTKKTKMTIEQAFNERRGNIAKRMHVAKMGDGFHILEIPGGDGEPFAIRSLPFASKRAAELFLDDLLDAYADADRDLNDVYCYRGSFVAYEQQARVLEFLEKRENIADLNALARDLVEFQPWEKRPSSSSGDPFSSSGDMESDPPF